MRYSRPMIEPASAPGLARRRALQMLAGGVAALGAGVARARAQGGRIGLAGLVESPELTLPGGRSVKAILMLPARLPAPAVALIHDRWGPDNSIYDRAEALVADRYVALMLDYMDGATPKDDSQAAAAVVALARTDALDIALAWLNWLMADARVNRAVGAIGWGVGADLALGASSRVPLKAAVLYYPQFKRKPDEMQGACPLLAHFPARDIAIAAELEGALAQARRKDRVFSYEADKDFADSTRPGFNRAEAALAWNRSVAFLRATLGKPPI